MIDDVSRFLKISVNKARSDSGSQAAAAAAAAALLLPTVICLAEKQRETKRMEPFAGTAGRDVSQFESDAALKPFCHTR